MSNGIIFHELVFEVYESKINITKEHFAVIMSGVAGLSVDLKVEIGVGNNWAEAH